MKNRIIYSLSIVKRKSLLIAGILLFVLLLVAFFISDSKDQELFVDKDTETKLFYIPEMAFSYPENLTYKESNNTNGSIQWDFYEENEVSFFTITTGSNFELAESNVSEINFNGVRFYSIRDQDIVKYITYIDESAVVFQTNIENLEVINEIVLSSIDINSFSFMSPNEVHLLEKGKELVANGINDYYEDNSLSIYNLNTDSYVLITRVAAVETSTCMKIYLIEKNGSEVTILDQLELEVSTNKPRGLREKTSSERFQNIFYLLNAKSANSNNQFLVISFVEDKIKLLINEPLSSPGINSKGDLMLSLYKDSPVSEVITEYSLVEGSLIKHRELYYGISAYEVDTEGESYFLKIYEFDQDGNRVLLDDRVLDEYYIYE